MKEADRIEQLKADAETLAATHPDIAHRLRKAIAFVIDRDAGPGIDAKSEITQLKEALERAEAQIQVAAETIKEREKTIKTARDQIADQANGHRAYTNRLTDEIARLQAELAKAPPAEGLPRVQVTPKIKKRSKRG